ncbi:MAG TPA: M1 family metallopeptidase [Blastocatellia bacterium]|nr:M1 family metallopeptidase [Blastocatellia bacterium]
MKNRLGRYVAAVSIILTGGGILLFSLNTASADAAAKHIVFYKIDAKLKLDEQQRPTTVEGHELLTWLNDSPDSVGELQLHLYLNAFKNQKSTFFVESRGESRDNSFEPGEWGWIDINSMKVEDGEDATKKIEFIHPDDDNTDDQTVIRVPLAKPVPAGGKITLDINFTSRLPRVFARSGYWGRFAMIVQWFPKIGVWEKIGDRRVEKAGWNCHQYHATSEFYADFGVYDVNLTVPPDYQDKVGATGKLKSQRDNQDGTVTYNYYQEEVHDFAWTADSNYVKVVRTFKAGENVSSQEIDDWAARLSLPKEQIALKDVDVTLLIQPEHASQIDRHFKAAFNAIKYFGLYYGKYPYDTLTVVDPPHRGEGAAGMEYPTLIAAGTSWWPGRDQNPEGVIVHEFGHQFWYGLVANNEFEESWLDEGFNTYSTGKVLETAYGAEVLPFRLAGVPVAYFPMEVRPQFLDRLSTLRGRFNDPIVTPAWKFYDTMSYGINSYPRTGLTLRTLERYLGQDTMARVMREYHQKWRYRHPASQDFFDTVNAVSGRDMNWFFDQFVKGTQTLDYEISHVTTEPMATKAGIYETDGQKSEVKVEEKEPVGAQYETEISVRRLGEAYFPIEMSFRFDDKSHITVIPSALHNDIIEYRVIDSQGREWTDSWSIKDRWKKFKFTTGSKLREAELDPGRKVLLDANMTNNSWTAGSGVRAAVRWSSGSMFWFQTLLQFVGGLT